MVKEEKSEKLLLLIALSVFYLNDILFLFKPSAIVFYLSDYLMKGIIFIGIIFVIKRDKEAFRYLAIPKTKILSSILWTAALIVSGIIIDQIVWRSLYNVLPKLNWQLSFPVLPNPVHKIFDLTIGIFLVAFTEEYIFRYLLPMKLTQRFSMFIAAASSLVLFGLAHWSFGLTALISTTMWAVLPLVSVLRLKTLVPAMIAHYVTDVIAFSGAAEHLIDGLLL